MTNNNLIIMKTYASEFYTNKHMHYMLNHGHVLKACCPEL